MASRDVFKQQHQHHSRQAMLPLLVFGESCPCTPTVCVYHFLVDSGTMAHWLTAVSLGFVIVNQIEKINSLLLPSCFASAVSLSHPASVFAYFIVLQSSPFPNSPPTPETLSGSDINRQELPLDTSSPLPGMNASGRKAHAIYIYMNWTEQKSIPNYTNCQNHQLQGLMLSGYLPVSSAWIWLFQHFKIPLWINYNNKYGQFHHWNNRKCRQI